MNRFSGFLLVWRHAFGRSLRGKRAIGLILFAALPVFVAAMNVSFARAPSMERYLIAVVVMTTLQIAVPFSALLLGIAVMEEEIEGRTITYLFTRPLPRPVFFAARLMGFASGMGVILAVSQVSAAMIYATKIELSTAQIFWTTMIGLSGFLAYMAFFAALRTLFAKALYWGFLITFIVEVAVSKMPFGGLTKCSVWHHLTVLVTRLYEGHPFKVGQGGVQQDETVGFSLMVLAGVFLVSLAIGAWRVRTHEIRVPAAVA